VIARLAAWSSICSDGGLFEDAIGAGRIGSVARRCSEVSDTDAAAALAKEISDVPPGALQAEIDGWHRRGDVRNDRARRLLIGVRDGGVVPSIDPGMRDQFVRENEIGRLPLSDAVEQVAGDFAVEVIELGSAFRARGKPNLRELNKLQRKIDSQYGELARDVSVAYLVSSARRQDAQTTYFDKLLRGRHGTIG